MPRGAPGPAALEPLRPSRPALKLRYGGAEVAGRRARAEGAGCIVVGVRVFQPDAGACRRGGFDS